MNGPQSTLIGSCEKNRLQWLEGMLVGQPLMQVPQVKGKWQLLGRRNHQDFLPISGNNYITYEHSSHRRFSGVAPTCCRYENSPIRARLQSQNTSMFSGQSNSTIIFTCLSVCFVSAEMQLVGSFGNFKQSPDKLSFLNSSHLHMPLSTGAFLIFSFWT